ncbi:MAG: LamG domain-containing protein [Acidimicrobiales bacterium]|nr:LamG domain-containing protein [Acidimicrobiales bacterium]
MSRRVRAFWLLVVLLMLAMTGCDAGRSLRFFGTGSGRADRVEIALDAPARPVDVGAGAFTIEWWMRGWRSNNPSGVVACGAGAYGWIGGHVVVDRDRFPFSGPDGRDFGVSVDRYGDVAFGAQDGTGAASTVCTDLPGDGVLDGRWHHVAVERTGADHLQIWVDGVRRADGVGPAGDLSYPDGTTGARPADPYLVIGAEKHDVGAAYPSFAGRLDELRVSSIRRYRTAFARPTAPFVADSATVGLYHFDEAAGSRVTDSSGAVGGPSHGLVRFTPSGARPARTDDTPFG